MYKIQCVIFAITIGSVLAPFAVDALADKIDLEYAEKFSDTVEDEGYGVEFLEHDEEDGTVLFGIKSRGSKALVYVFPDGQLLFRSYWKDQGDFSFKAINEWNQNHLFARMYIDEDQDIALQADVIVCDGKLEIQEISYYTNMFFELKRRAYDWIRKYNYINDNNEKENKKEKESKKLNT